MQEIKIKAWKTEYILNNNSNKYQRAKITAGDDTSSETILAMYDRLAGLIKDTDGNIIENGIFWQIYKKRKEEQPRYIKIIEDREKTLEAGEKRTIELISKNIDHKRAFLGNIMYISAMMVAGLFVILTSASSGKCLIFLAKIDGIVFISFLITATAYLTYLLSGESRLLDKTFKFAQDSKKDFIENIGIAITDIDSYEEFREQRHREEKEIKKEIKFSSEFWFIFINILFVLSCLLVGSMFILTNNPDSFVCEYLNAN